MKNNNDSIQNRFTAYLVISIENRKKSYFKQKKYFQQMEQKYFFSEAETFTEFESLYFDYLIGLEKTYVKNWDHLYKILSLIDNEVLQKKIKKLKSKEQIILLARLYGEFSFKEIGEKLNISAKQAEMSYYYVLRKLRKELKRDGI